MANRGLVPEVVTIRSVDQEVAILMCDVLFNAGARTVLLADYPRAKKKSPFPWR